jgi:hypothetical protein
VLWQGNVEVDEQAELATGSLGGEVCGRFGRHGLLVDAATRLRMHTELGTTKRC